MHKMVTMKFLNKNLTGLKKWSEHDAVAATYCCYVCGTASFYNSISLAV